MSLFSLSGFAAAGNVGKKADGFILNDQASAFKAAKAEDKLLLIDFFGIWCPPCNQYDEHVFGAPEFARGAERFVKLKLDADADVSWELKSKFKIQGYPTIVFATPEGDEVGRVVGYRPLKRFLKDAAQAWKNRDRSYARLAAASEKGDRSAAAKIGSIEFERGNYAAAMKYLAQAKDAKFGEKIAIADLNLLEAKVDGDPKAKPDYLGALEKSIRDYPNSPDSVGRRTTLAEASEGEKKTALLKDAIKTAQELIQHPARLDGLDYSTADLKVAIAEARAKLGDAAGEKAAWTEAAKDYRGRMKSADERGYSLELAYCLWKSGEAADADAIYGKFEALYPNEFTFFHAHANMQFELKKYAEAQALQEKAFRYSYGDNKLRAGYNLARILKARDRKKEAIAVAEKALAEVKLPVDATIRSHRSAARLRKMIAELKG